MMPAQKPPTFLDRFLNLFADVRSGEGLTAVLLTFNVFLVLMAYYMAKVVREPLILVGGGAEVKSYAGAGQALLLVAAVKLYAWLAGRYSRKQLITAVNVFFAGNLAVFYLLALTNIPYLGVAFFLWVGMFNVMVVAQFWSFANDLYTPDEGKRLFAIVAFGSNAGAVVGSFAAGRLISFLQTHHLGGSTQSAVYPLLLVAAGVLLVSLVVTHIVDRRERHRLATRGAKKTPVAEKPIGKGDAFKLVFKHRYLLMIGGLVLLLNWVNTTGEFILGATVEETAKSVTSDPNAQKDFVGQFYANFFTGVNLAAMFLQLFLVSRILKYLGIRVALLILPVIALGGYFILAFYPLLTMVRWAKTAENATDYSLNNTVRHALFLPTSREEKYQAKQAIDSFFHRSGDVLQALLVFVGLNFFGFHTREFALVNVGLVLVWLGLAFQIGLENQRLVARRQAERVEPSA